MPSKNEETKLQSDPAADKILSELLPPPPPLQNPREEDDVAAITAASVPILTDSMNDCLTPFLEYDSICHPEEDEDDEDEDVEERCYDAEEVFFTKFLNQKFITRGYKRQPVKNKAVRAETRRKYQHFRIVQKKKDEKNRKNEKYIYDCLPLPFSNTSTPLLSQTPDNPNPATNPPTTSSQNSTPSGNTPAPNTTSSTTPSSDPFGSAKYLTLQAERDYLDAVRQSSVQLAPTTGLSTQQMLDMCNRDLTPEDYELLLRLDEALEKKTVKQETLTNLMEQIIDKEVQLAEVCTICMFNYELGDRAKYLPCNHFFHVDCIVPYLSSYGQSCPVCKSKV